MKKEQMENDLIRRESVAMGILGLTIVDPMVAQYADAVLLQIHRAPTIDAVEVVRCKDCRHCGFCGESTNLEVMGFYGYCSRGERKDDEQ